MMSYRSRLQGAARDNSLSRMSTVYRTQIMENGDTTLRGMWKHSESRCSEESGSSLSDRHKQLTTRQVTLVHYDTRYYIWVERRDRICILRC